MFLLEGRRLDLSGAGYVVEYFEPCIEPGGSIKCNEFLDQLRN